MGEELFLLYFSPSCSIKTQALQSCLIVYKGSFHKRIQNGDAVIKKISTISSGNLEWKLY